MRVTWLMILFAGTVTAGQPLVGIGHMPIAVRNLDEASTDYRALGFTIKPGHLHDDGILNNHVKFAAGTELELITASGARDELAAKYGRMIAAGDGPAFLALEWQDSGRVRAALAAAGIGYREGAYFTLSDPRLDYLFFGGNDRSPSDRPEHYAHANGANALIGVWLADAENPALTQLLRALGASLVERDVTLPEPMRVTVAEIAGGVITLLPKSQRLIADRPIVGAVVRTQDLERIAAQARKAGFKDLFRPMTGTGFHSLILPPAATHGLWLEFRMVDAAQH